MGEPVAAAEILNDAFELIGVRSQGETLAPAEAQGGLRRLNQLVAQWHLMPLTSTATIRSLFPLIAGKGTPDNPYTVGTGGDFDMPRPVDLEAVGLIVVATPPFELPRTLYTEAAYRSIEDKQLTSNYFAGAYYLPTYAGGLAQLFLYPIPTQSLQIALYHHLHVNSFPDLTTKFDLPPGAVDALTYELARRLARPYGREWPADLAKDASDYLGLFKRANTRMADLTLDPALTDTSAAMWDIETDP